MTKGLIIFTVLVVSGLLAGCTDDTAPKKNVGIDLGPPVDLGPSPDLIAYYFDMSPPDAHPCAGQKKPCCCKDDMILGNNGQLVCLNGKWKCPSGWYEKCDSYPNYYCHGHSPPQAMCATQYLGKLCSTTAPTACKAPVHFCLFAAGKATGTCTCKCTPDNPKTPLINEDTCPTGTTTGQYRCKGKPADSGVVSYYCLP